MRSPKSRDHALDRLKLSDYVREHGFSDPNELARLVNNAPAMGALTAWEWWNVALALAFHWNYKAENGQARPS